MALFMSCGNTPVNNEELNIPTRGQIIQGFMFFSNMLFIDLGFP